MKYIVLFEDNPAADPQIRSKYMPEHLAFLEANALSVDAAGPLFEPGGTGAGGIWVVDADGAGAVEALVRSDPFWPTGLRKSYQVLEWLQVYADGRRLG